LDCSVGLAMNEATLAGTKWANDALSNGTTAEQMNRCYGSQTFEDGVRVLTGASVSF
jgi:hypothetical protein